MRILLVNDDGIAAPQLPNLIRWCQKLGQVTVFAPKVEQSGKSHSIELRHAFEVLPVSLVEGVDCYSVDSSPADCVRFAVMGMKQQFDLVISGVNRGFNMGTDIMYSGTVAGIFEAANLGIPGIALSTNPGNYDHACDQLDRVWAYFQQHKLLEVHSHYNVNIPADPKGFAITRQGGPFYSDNFDPIGDNLYQPSGFMIYKSQDDMTLDSDAVTAGYISVMPLSVNRADDSIYKLLTSTIPSQT